MRVVNPPSPPLEQFDNLLALGRPLIMGIVNVTPDSFYDGGWHNDPEAAVDHALRLMDDGADLVDIGGESTRPPGRDYGRGAVRVSAAVEADRVVRVIEGIVRHRPDAVLSVDTTKSDVARESVRAGAAMINDVSAGRGDPEMIAVAAQLHVPYVLMHGYVPEHVRSPDAVHYRDVVEEVLSFLDERIALARRAGIARPIADVGIGFEKNAAANREILRRYERFRDLGVPTLLGASRKSFIGRLLGGLPPAERLEGSLAAAARAVLGGASIVRTHDVLQTHRFLTVLQSLTTINGD